MTPEKLEALSQQIKNEIDEWCRVTYDDGPRSHLGASKIGEDCARKLWYDFRWMARENHSGRMQRLFQVGHNAEPRFIQYLRGIGFEVWERDPATGKQFKIEGVEGHFSGSCDGVAKREEVFLLEFKTNGTGQGYNAVDSKGVRLAKPLHWAQMCTYGYKLNIRYGLYLIENKNDSDITPQIVELDWKLGEEMERKAEFIIRSNEAPKRISESEAHFDCKYCAAKGVCHKQHVPLKNCRSCISSMPTENKTWRCAKYGVIPEHVIKDGCDEWTGR